MADSVYDAGDLIGKTFRAAQNVTLYSGAYDNAPVAGTISAGQNVGVLYSYLQPLPTYGRNYFFWWFKDGRGVDFYTRQLPNIYDTNFFQQQGVLTVQQKIEAEQTAGLPWYEQLLKKYGIWVLVAIVGSGAIKGYLSRPQK